MAERVSGSALEALSGATANERVSGVSLEVLATEPEAGLRESGLSMEVLADAQGGLPLKIVKPPSRRTVFRLLKAQHESRLPVRHRWPTLLQRISSVPPAGGTSAGTSGSVSPPPLPDQSGGIQQDLWLAPTADSVYQATVILTRIHGNY